LEVALVFLLIIVEWGRKNLSFIRQHSVFHILIIVSIRINTYYALTKLSGGEVPLRQFTAALPLPQQAIAWQIAYDAACSFWNTVSQDERINLPFREIPLMNLEQLVQLQSTVTHY
jgi:hypothetical protein